MFKQDDRPGWMSEMLLQGQFTSILAMSFYDNTRLCPSFIPRTLLWPLEPWGSWGGWQMGSVPWYSP